MDKPITMLANEFKISQIELITNSNLPYFVIESILKDCLNEVHIASQRQLKMDEQKYKEELSKLKNKSVESGESNG